MQHTCNTPTKTSFTTFTTFTTCTCTHTHAFPRSEKVDFVSLCSPIKKNRRREAAAGKTNSKNMKHWPHATFYTFNILPFTFYHSTHSTHSTFYTFYKHETLHTQIHSSSPFGSQTILQLTCCINWTPFGFGAHSILHHVAWHFELNIAFFFTFSNNCTIWYLIFQMTGQFHV